MCTLRKINEREIIVMKVRTVVKVMDNAVVLGEFTENGGFAEHRRLFANEVNTEQKVLAWIYFFCSVEGIDQCTIKSFIDRCTDIHPALDIHNTGV